MKPIRIFHHINCGKPGYLLEFLQRHGLPFQVDCIGETSPVSVSLDDVSGLVIMGGPGDVNSPLSWMRQEEVLIQQAAERDIPIMGVCLGAQMIARALGGTVSSNYQLEVGWHHAEIVDGAQIHPWMQGLPTRFEVFQWHAHEFTNPPDSTPLLTSRCTPCQAFSAGNILAMQFHLEISADIVRSLARQFAGDLEDQSSCVQQAGELCSQLDERVERLHSMADLIYAKWLAHLG